jgi:hypothetical protein
VCRKEIYRVKANIFHAVNGYTHKLTSDEAVPPTRKDQLFRELSKLVSFLDDIIVGEFCDRSILGRLQTTFIDEPLDNNSRVECDFCGADIFQSFFECGECDGFVICPGCYVDGRLCRCSAMTPMQYHDIRQIINTRNIAAKLVLAGSSNRNYPSRRVVSIDELNEALLSR